jgi:hypothetical protein
MPRRHKNEVQIVRRPVLCMSIVLLASFEALAESTIESDAPMGIVSVTATPTLDRPAANANAMRPSAEIPLADSVQLKAAEPLERVFISNIPGVGQSLPEPVQLSETSTSPSSSKPAHRKLAFVPDASAADMLRKLRLSSTAALGRGSGRRPSAVRQERG